jgi:hypothetical protein
MNFVLPGPPSAALRFNDVVVGETNEYIFDFGQYWTTKSDPVISAAISVGVGLSIMSETGIIASEVLVHIRGDVPNVDTVIYCRVATSTGRVATRCAAVYGRLPMTFCLEM